MEHGTHPNRLDSRSRFVSPFCACFNEKKILTPRALGPLQGGRGAAAGAGGRRRGAGRRPTCRDTKIGPRASHPTESHLESHCKLIETN